MKSRRIVVFILLTGVAAISLAGDIQVSCKPGLSIYLDGQYMGESTAMQDGLFLMNVKNGTRTIRVEKDGFVPRTIEVEVTNFPIEVRIGELVPNPSGRRKQAPTPAVKTESNAPCRPRRDSTRSAGEHIMRQALDQMNLGLDVTQIHLLEQRIEQGLRRDTDIAQ